MPVLSGSWPWVLHCDASSCNGCDIELVASLTRLYDVERLGVINTGNPKHADIFLVTGSVNAQNVKVLRTLYEQMPEPRVVVAVDLYVPGCAARPEPIIDGILQAIGILEKKRAIMKGIHGQTGEMVMARATALDAPEILALQKIVYQHEAEIYDDWSLTPLTQTLADLRVDFESKTFIKAVVGGKIVGSLRGYMVEVGTAHVSRLIVHPYFWQRRIGTKLVQEIEGRFPDARRFETFTGQKSTHTMEPYQRLGCAPIRQEKVSRHRDRVCFAKEKEQE